MLFFSVHIKEKKKNERRRLVIWVCYLAWVHLLCLHCFDNQDFFQNKSGLFLGEGVCWVSLEFEFVYDFRCYFILIFFKDLLWIRCFGARAREVLNARFSFIIFWAHPCKNSYNPGFGLWKIGANTLGSSNIRITLGSGF